MTVAVLCGGRRSETLGRSMDERQERQSTGGLVWRFALHTAVLFAAMAAPFFVLEYSAAYLVAFGAVGLHVLWRFIAAHLRDRREPKQALSVNLLDGLFSAAVPVMMTGLAFVSMFVWPMWAYRPDAHFGDTLANGPALIFWATAVSIALPMAFILIAPFLAPKDGGAGSRFLTGIRAQGLGRFYKNWVSYAALTMGILSFAALALAYPMLYVMERWHYLDDEMAAWALAKALPGLPLAMLVSAAMLSAARYLEVRGEETTARIKAYIDGAAEVPSLNARARTGLCALVACGYIAALFAILYPHHLQLLKRDIAKGFTNIGGVGEAAINLAERIRADGGSLADYAAESNRTGFWNPDTPEAGLATLVANPAEVFTKNCTVRIEMEVADPPADDSAGLLGIVEDGDLNYCIRIACASPVIWDAPPVLMLFTSRDSQAENWVNSLYADVTAAGAVPAPGGYCTADGKLAETYQG